ncbi:hypothetical protein ACO2Q2_06500 [Dyella sp. KRB-257]|uniref:hypothetical protein n=1 Tax=Dyella sp. KRB-257 TaxID=3400915 RepID=UPI003C071877
MRRYWIDPGSSDCQPTFECDAGACRAPVLTGSVAELSLSSLLTAAGASLLRVVDGAARSPPPLLLLLSIVRVRELLPALCWPTFRVPMSLVLPIASVGDAPVADKRHPSIQQVALMAIQPLDSHESDARA